MAKIAENGVHVRARQRVANVSIELNVRTCTQIECMHVVHCLLWAATHRCVGYASTHFEQLDRSRPKPKIGTRPKMHKTWHFGLTKVAFGATFARRLCVVARENAHR